MTDAKAAAYDAALTRVWADGEHRFRLRIGELRELQAKTGVGPHALYQRLSLRQWLVDDLREIIRLGLIGGGMPPVEALGLVKRYVEERPLLESVEPALAILGVALLGPEPEGDRRSGEEGPPEPETTSSTSAASSKSAVPSASTPGGSTTSASASGSSTARAGRKRTKAKGGSNRRATKNTSPRSSG